ncbi:FecR domain-containing protein [Rugamonas sp. A1-17]|nr:FecR domain-containing protein [Rugamonas sp. A1-17]
MHIRFLLALGSAAMFCSGIALADPPARVARLAYLSGPVSFSAAGADDWQTAGINRPLVAGDRLWTAAGARDEVQAGPAAVRMGGETLVTLLNADDTKTQLQLSQGRLNLRVRQLRPDEVLEVDTPNLAFSIRKPGHYRLQVDASGNATEVAVIDGQGEAYGDNTSYLVDPGQAYRFTGTGLQDFSVNQLPPADDFDRWAAQRDRRLEHPVAARYVSSDVVGYEDLDDNGDWRDVPGYGNVWMPAHVASDWAPYRDGHWAWVDPWGWTWVDDAPWGFAVSHYGRWAQTPAGWGWVPGPVVQRPVYAPALVVFVGAATLMVGQRDPGVAWFPLGPREVYRPSYRASPVYVTNINTSNTVINKTQITNVYNNVNITNVRYVNRQAVTAVPARAFAQAQPVRQNAMRVAPQALAAAPLAAAPAVKPQRPAALAGGQGGPRPAPAILARPVVAKTAPAVAAARMMAPQAGKPAQGAAQAAANVRMVRAARPTMPVPAPAGAQQLAQKGGAHGPAAAAPASTPAPLMARPAKPGEIPPQAALHQQPAAHPESQPPVAQHAQAESRLPPGQHPGAEPHASMPPQPVAQAHPQPVPPLQAQARPQPAPHPQTEAHPQPVPHPQAEAGPQPAPHLQAEARPQPAPHPQAEARPQPAPHQQAEARPQPAPHPQAEARATPPPKAPPREPQHVAQHPSAEAPPHREAAHHDPKQEPKRE